MEKEIEIDIELFEKCRNNIPLPLPPRLEDAGLEDCALSTEGIREAFLKAAQAVKSTILQNDEEGQYGGECIEGDGPFNGEWTDSLQDFSHNPNNNGRGQSCVESLVGGLVEESNDKLIGIGLDNVQGDQIVDGGKPGKQEDGVCVPGLDGVPGSRAEKDENGKEEEEKEEEGPILAETYV